MIELKNVSVIKSSFRLMENVNWKLNENEHWIITGRNGSGKTLLLELLAGIIHAAHGQVVYDFITGTSWDQLYAQRKALIHYIPTHAIQAFLQNHELFYQQRYYSMGDERIPVVAEIMGEDVHRLDELTFPAGFAIDSLLNVPINKLSNGQLKKLLILKGLTHNIPRVLLLDYPFEGLDHRSRADLIEFLDHLVNEFGMQLIIADHDHHLPRAINRKMVLDRGQIKLLVPFEYTTIPPDKVNATAAEGISSDLPVVEMKNVTIRYGDKVVIHNLNWKIHKGERWALTGANGSGKTTLFSLIFADHPLTYCEQVYLFGKRRGSGESIWDIKRRINYLGPELISYLNPKSERGTGVEYILSRNTGIDPLHLNNIIRFFDAEIFMQKPVRHLSSGHLQLMLIINTLLSDKELLLLDEPFQFLDTSTKERVQQYIQSHLQKDTTLILITHYENDIARWTNHRLHL